MRTLIVGAGAVGLVYGRHLQEGGWQVDFYVKEKYAAEVAEGPVLYALNSRDRTTPQRLTGAAPVVGPEDLAQRHAEAPYELVMLAISATALYGDWLAPFLAALPGVPVVMLQPGFAERELLETTSPGRPIIQGLIPFLSYHAPLPGETRFTEPGTAWWLPWMTKCPFAGPAEVVKPLVATLNKGGLPSKTATDLSVSSAYASATFNTAMAALELSDWRFDSFRKGGTTRASATAREAWAVLHKELDAGKPAAMGLWGPTVANIATRLAAGLAPVDIETFFEVHFTKVADQTEHQLRQFIEGGERHGVPTPELTRMLEDLRLRRGRQGA